MVQLRTQRGGKMPHCPYYEKVAGKGDYAVTGYCRGYRSGKLRIPTLGELRKFCILDCYSCAVYRFRVLEESAEPKESSVAC